MNLNFVRFIILIICVFFQTACPSVQNTTYHYNQVSILREGSQKITFTFSLNIASTFQKNITPNLNIDSFLKQYASMPIDQFKKEIDLILLKLQSNCIVYTPQGSKYTLTNWHFPEPITLQNILKDEISIQQIPPEFKAHLDPTAIKAELQSKEPIYRIKIQMDNTLMPLWVINTERDKFWMTEQIPEVIINVP